MKLIKDFKSFQKNVLKILDARMMKYGMEITKIKNGGKQFSANWQKASNASGYQIQYAVNKDIKNSKLKTINGNKNKTTIKKQNTHKKYYVRVRQYKIADGKKYYSKWSKPVAVKPIKE